jgi:aldehyde:ferredoxin oxidoreductase
LYKELEKKIDSLSLKNKIIIAPGLAQNTRIPISGRYAVGAKKPIIWIFFRYTCWRFSRT